jgi:mannose-6-phosphate isomerase-like protein (cupin superfamily)
VVECPDTPVAFVDDPVPARSRPWIDAEDFHVKRVRTSADDYGGGVEIVDLTALDGRGPAWGTASEELNATLLVWRAAEGQPEHVNTERDVAVVALAGSGTLTVDGAGHVLAAGTLAIVPRGASRSIVAGRAGLRCLTVHRRRGGLGLGDFRDGKEDGRG